LNEHGRIWTMVAGGGASVIFADTIVEKGGVTELANYGEYSGAPNEGQASHFHLKKSILKNWHDLHFQVRIRSHDPYAETMHRCILVDDAAISEMLHWSTLIQ
jgi:hypothetical protein